MLRTPLLIGTLLLSALAAPAQTECSPSGHSISEAWFTGPMLANTAATPARGHFLLEPYLTDTRTLGAYSPSGTRLPAPAASSYASETYLIYGLTNRLAAGALPLFGYNTIPGQPTSAGPVLGDLTLIVQRRLTGLYPCHHIPTVALAVEQTLPTGAFDNLGSRPANALGQGVFTATPAIFSQLYLWLPNGRILRSRLDIYDSISTTAGVTGVSVYGTATGFRGTAHPGNSLTLDAAFEYSVTRRFALATDAVWHTSADTRVSGIETSASNSAGMPIGPTPITMNSGSSTAWAFAPAVEYSWRPWIGILIGVRLYPAGHNTPDTITPGIAVNIFR